MNVYLFGFSKKQNSTKRPTTSDGVLFDMQLKEETSVTNPALIVNKPNTMPTVYNYAYIPALQRYYFISDWQYINGAWICYCNVDVLASYKLQIAGTSAYVLRSASAYDGRVCDSLYPCKAGFRSGEYHNEFFSMALSQTGLYVVGIISKSAYATDGAVTYYMMKASEFGQLKSYLLDEGFLSLAGLNNIADIPKDFVKSYFDPFQYIVSCRFFPIDYDSATVNATSVSSIDIGWWSMTLSTKRMPSGFYMDIQSNTITAGTHPQALNRGTYLNHAPYTERILIHPMLGTVPLDANKIEPGDQITIATRLDFTTGEALTYVGNASKNLTLYTQAYMLAINVQIAQISQDMFAMTRAVVSTGASLISGAIGGAGGGLVGVAVGAIAGAASGVFNTLEASQPILSSSGCNGNRAVFHVAVWLQSFYHVIVDEDNADKGRPLCAVRTLGSLSGYILCSQAHADYPCYDSEKTQIENYLNSGFFYE